MFRKQAMPNSRRNSLLRVSLFFLTVFLSTQCLCRDKSSFAKHFKLDHSDFKKDLKMLTAEPHPFGSGYQKTLALYLKNRLKTDGVEAWYSTFSSTVPVDLQLASSPPEASDSLMNVARSIEGHNVFGYVGSSSKKSGDQCLYILGSHYDTKVVPGIEYVGANDGGSSSVLLLQLMKFIKMNPLECAVVGVWFDGEESVLWDWDAGEKSHPLRSVDNTYGSRYFVEKVLQDCSESGDTCWVSPQKKPYPVKAFVLLDMVGSKNLRISLDSNSNDFLRGYLLRSAHVLGYSDFIDDSLIPISDDHIPFIRRGIPAINIIDFNNLDFWHSPGDVFEQVSPESLQISGRIALQVLHYLDQNHK